MPVGLLRGAMEDLRYITVWIRFLVPLVCAAVLVSDPNQPLVLVIFIASLADAGLQLLRLGAKRQAMVNFRFALSRDAIYATVFFVANFHSTVIPALAISPIVVTELLLALGWRYFLIGFSLEMLLIVLRMGTVRMTTHHFVHPVWMMEVLIATAASTIFGLTLSSLHKVHEDIVAQRTLMKESLTQMLQATLAGDGLDGEISEESIRLMIEEICKKADPEQGRQLGNRLAHLLALRQSSKSLLTTRERELLFYLASGLSYSKIAAKLVVSEGTVRAHAASIMRKADVHTRQEAVEWAKELRLIAKD